MPNALSAAAPLRPVRRAGDCCRARADAVVVDATEPALLGVPTSRTLDALVFSSPSQPFADVMVAGRWAIRNAERHGAGTKQSFAAAMHGLWND